MSSPSIVSVLKQTEFTTLQSFTCWKYHTDLDMVENKTNQYGPMERLWESLGHWTFKVLLTVRVSPSSLPLGLVSLFLKTIKSVPKDKPHKEWHECLTSTSTYQIYHWTKTHELSMHAAGVESTIHEMVMYIVRQLHYFQFIVTKSWSTPTKTDP